MAGISTAGKFSRGKLKTSSHWGWRSRGEELGERQRLAPSGGMIVVPSVPDVSPRPPPPLRICTGHSRKTLANTL
ncbi:hypothetical protein G5I_10318 [Acromyrmex echinatior]|uniref:Uncharacterized protein n=1 Tax=Acromyrmex echinatior TaxID=103372 RepID=F4WWK4_ACREC|nr:hypothetical protein G5I_10318 [Acromyrmex echinatior]